jgi:hypothetical protein
MGYIGKQPTPVPLSASDLDDDIISLAKLAGGTDGNVISYDASGDPVAIATGNDGQVLTSAGAGQPCAFEAAAGGGAWTFIKSATASTASSVDFVDGTSDVVIDATYIAYQIWGFNIETDTDDSRLMLQYSTDTGSSWITSGYDATVYKQYDGGGVERDDTDAAYTIDSIGTGTNEFCNFHFTIFDPSDASNYTFAIGHAANRDHSASANMFFQVGGSCYETAGAVDGFRLILQSSALVSGTFKLYGLNPS